MPNPKGNESSLVKYKPKWKSGKTQTIRVPISISDLVLEAAQEIDNNGNKSLLQVIEQLENENNMLKNNQYIKTIGDDREQLETILEEAIITPSNRGGQIKKLIAKLGGLIGFNIQKTSKGWIIIDNLT